MKNRKSRYIMCLISAPREKAEAIAKAFVVQKLAACAQIINPIRSIYWWKGKIEEEREALLLLKTKAALTEKIKIKLKEIHPYEVPELIILPILDGYDPYLAWISESLSVRD